MISVKCEKERKIWTHLKYSQFFIKPRSKTCTKRKKYGRSGLSVIWKVVGINFSNEQLFGRKISRVKVLRIKHGAERIFSGVKIPTVQYGILNLLFHLNDTHKGGIKVCQEFVELVLTESIELINVGSVVFVFYRFIPINQLKYCASSCWKMDFYLRLKFLLVIIALRRLDGLLISWANKFQFAVYENHNFKWKSTAIHHFNLLIIDFILTHYRGENKHSN